MARYFAMIEGTQRGPFTLDELEASGVGPETYVWCKGMDTWQQASEVADICRHFRRLIYDRMHPSPPDAPTEIKESRDSYDEIPYRWRYLLMKSETPAEMLPEAEPDVSEPPHTRLWAAIVVTLLCFPTGAVAIYYILRSRREWSGGKGAEAHASARKALIWTLAGVVAACFMAAVMIKAGIS